MNQSQNMLLWLNKTVLAPHFSQFYFAEVGKGHSKA
jgi:hypothetical protein